MNEVFQTTGDREACMAGGSSLTGQWTYRSYLNSADLVTDADSALAMIFGQGIFTFETPSSTTLKGTFDMAAGSCSTLRAPSSRQARIRPSRYRSTVTGVPAPGRMDGSMTI